MSSYLTRVSLGRGPVEDCGGTYGWDKVKIAFRALRAASANERQHELVTWAGEVSGLGDAFDPFAVPDIVQMNDEGRWEHHLRASMIGCENDGEDEF